MKAAQLIEPNGETTEIHPANGNDFSIQECYKLIKCRMVEIVELNDGRIMILDEEGKLQNEIEKNEKATAMFQQGRPKRTDFILAMKKKYGNNFVDAGVGDNELDDMIVGAVIVCSSDMFL